MDISYSMFFFILYGVYLRSDVGMSVTASSLMLIYASLSFCLFFSVTYSDIELGLLFTMRIAVCLSIGIKRW